MSIFNITRWPTALVFLLAGTAAVGFAFVTVNLFSQAMANRAFIREYGWLAIQSGAALQIGYLLFWGGVALACWVTFKICEQEMSTRYFAWARRRKEPSESAKKSPPQTPR